MSHSVVLPLPFSATTVVEGHRLANGLLFGLPVVLDTEREDLVVGDRVLLTYNGEASAAATAFPPRACAPACACACGSAQAQRARVLARRCWLCLPTSPPSAALRPTPSTPASLHHSQPSLTLPRPPHTPPPTPTLRALQELAVFTVESKWKPNKPLEAQNCYRTTSIEHPAVQVMACMPRAALPACYACTPRGSFRAHLLKPWHERSPRGAGPSRDAARPAPPRLAGLAAARLSQPATAFVAHLVPRTLPCSADDRHGARQALHGR